MIDEPANSIYGGTVAAPTFSAMGAYCMEHLKIPPTPRKARLDRGLQHAGQHGNGGSQSDGE